MRRILVLPRILVPLGLLLVLAIVVYGYIGDAWWTWEGTGFSGAGLNNKFVKFVVRKFVRNS